MTWPLRKWRLNCHTSTATASAVCFHVRSWPCLQHCSLVLFPVPGLTSVFIYPQLSISISTVPAHFQASSRGTPSLGQSNPSLPLPLTFGSSIGHVLSFQIWRSARVRRSIVPRSAALHAAQLRDDWEES